MVLFRWGSNVKPTTACARDLDHRRGEGLRVSVTRWNLYSDGRVSGCAGVDRPEMRSQRSWQRSHEVWWRWEETAKRLHRQSRIVGGSPGLVDDAKSNQITTGPTRSQGQIFTTDAKSKSWHRREHSRFGSVHTSPPICHKPEAALKHCNRGPVPIWLAGQKKLCSSAA